MSAEEMVDRWELNPEWVALGPETEVKLWFVQRSYEFEQLHPSAHKLVMLDQ